MSRQSHAVQAQTRRIEQGIQKLNYLNFWQYALSRHEPVILNDLHELSQCGALWPVPKRLKGAVEASLRSAFPRQEEGEETGVEHLTNAQICAYLALLKWSCFRELPEEFKRPGASAAVVRFEAPYLDVIQPGASELPADVVVRLLDRGAEQAQFYGRAPGAADLDLSTPAVASFIAAIQQAVEKRVGSG